MTIFTPRPQWIVDLIAELAGEGGGTWGAISGTLTNQTDLQAALNAKANSVHTHVVGDVTSLQTTLDGKLAASNNLSDVANASTALTNLGVSTFAKTLLDDTTAAAARATLAIPAAVDGAIEIPTTSQFTTGWINQGTATVADDADGIFWTNDNDGEYHLLMMPAPSKPFDIYMKAEGFPFGNATLSTTITCQPAIILRDSSDGEFIACQAEAFRVSSQSNFAVSLQRWTNPTTFNFTPNRSTGPRPLEWVRVNVTSTTITLYCAIGRRWVELTTEPLSSFVDAVDQIGIGVRSDSTNTAAYAKFKNFGFSDPFA